MRNVLKLMVVGAFALLITVPAAFAQTAVPENSVLNVNEPLDVGGTILQPGTYLIKSMDESTDRRMIQVIDPDTKRVFATVLTVPHHLDGSEDIPNTMFTFYPAADGRPAALRTWFPPDSVRMRHKAYDIVYSESRARELARLADAPVVTYRENVPVTELEVTEIRRVTPQQTIEVYEAPAPRQTTGTTMTETMTMTERTLPRTAGEVPMMALLGLLFVGAAVAFRAIR